MVKIGWLNRWDIRQMTPAGARRYAVLVAALGVGHALLRAPYFGHRRWQWYHIVLPIAGTILTDVGDMWFIRRADRILGRLAAWQRTMENDVLADAERDAREGRTDPVHERLRQLVLQRRQRTAEHQDTVGTPGPLEAG